MLIKNKQISIFFEIFENTEALINKMCLKNKINYIQRF